MPNWVNVGEMPKALNGAGVPSGSRPAHISKEPTAVPQSPVDVINAWRDQGALVKLATSIDPLDQLCRGGLSVPRRVGIIGAPSAGKSFLQMVIGNAFLRSEQCCVGVLAVDEDPEDLVVRYGQMRGFTLDKIEARSSEVLAGMIQAFDSVALRFYDGSHAIEAAAEDVAQWAVEKQRHGVLLIDSIQTVRSRDAANAKGGRELVELNVQAVRYAADKMRLLTIYTSEANRASYRNEQAAADSNDMAAGAESRAIEFGAQTQLMLRTPKGHPDVIHVRVPKNRRNLQGEFWLRLDRESHSVEECEDPAGAPETARERDEQRAEQKSARARADADLLARVLAPATKHKPMTKREVRALAGEKGGIGHDRCDRALDLLAQGHADWVLEGGKDAAGKFHPYRMRRTYDVNGS